MNKTVIYPFLNKKEFSIWIILFAISCTFMFRIIGILYPVVSSIFVELYIFLPTIFVLIVPFVLFVAMYFKNYSRDIVKTTHKVALFLIIGGICSFIYQFCVVLFVPNLYQINSNITIFFPYDIFAYQIIYIIGGVLLYKFAYMFKGVGLEIQLSYWQKFLFTISSFFSIFFTSYLFSIFTSLEIANDINCLPFYLSTLLPFLYSVMFQIRQSKSNRQFGLFLLIVGGLTTTIYIWIITVLLVNPYFVYEHLRSVFRIGVVLGISIDFFCLTLFVFVSLIVYSIKYFRFKCQN